MTDIKKAFNQFKKDLDVECAISGGFTMSQKQIANRTATYCVASTTEFREMINFFIREDYQVQGYNTWTVEAKQKAHERHERSIQLLEEQEALYGDRHGQAMHYLDKIRDSKAFARFQRTVGDTQLTIERAKDAWYIRFNY